MGDERDDEETTAADEGQQDPSADVTPRGFAGVQVVSLPEGASAVAIAPLVDPEAEGGSVAEGQ